MTESMSDIGYAGVTGIPTRTSPKTLNSHRKKAWITHLAVAGWLCAAAGSAVAQDSLRARNLAATCANCHGTNGHARDGMMPLAGVNADWIVATLGQYKRGEKSATLMQQIAKGYTDAQIRLIADHLAAQAVTK